MHSQRYFINYSNRCLQPASRFLYLPFRRRSDAVWDRFLPCDFHDLVSCSVNPYELLFFPKKKDVYHYLCDNPLLIDAGTRTFSLDKKSGKICYMLAARALSIAWGDTPMYWKWTSSSESRFGEIAELVKVCWLEIRGKISKCELSPDTTYAAYLVFKSPVYMDGLMYSPAHVSFGGGTNRLVYLDANEVDAHMVETSEVVWCPGVRACGSTRRRVMSGEVQFPKTRVDGWLEVELGEYYVDGGDDDTDLEMHVMEVKDDNWKSGLVVQGIEIRPKFNYSKI